MGVVAAQVVENDGNLHVGAALRLLSSEVQPEVALVVRCTAIGTGEMVVVSDHSSGILPADVACSGRGEVLDVDGCHRHRDGAVDSVVE